MSDSRIKKAVIREDLLSITKDYRKAILLNQFIYWSERVSDADKFIEKENEIARSNGEEEREPFYGWIYKTAEELAEEVMLGLSASQIRRHINDLVDMGYLSKRNNPKYKWDRTLQYKVNLANIAKDLKKNGYPLSDYKIDIPDDENCIAHGCAFNDACMLNQSCADARAIPEITTDTTTEITKTEELTNASPTVTVPCEKQKRTFSFDERMEMLEKMPERARIVALQLGHSDELSGNIADFIYYFVLRYCQKTGEIHPILKNDTLVRIIRSVTEQKQDDFHTFDSLVTDTPGDDRYKQVVDEYFNTDFGRDVNYNLSHFVSGDIIKNLMYHTGEFT